MKYGLGIDTGGTYTDAVIMDLDEKKILAKAKSHTTYDDLSKGISKAVEAVLQTGVCKADQISLTGLSTTLATNSILQGKGGEVGLIGIGWKPDDGWSLGTEHVRFITGRFDSLGKMLDPLDMGSMVQAIEELLPHVDAMVVSGHFSISNPMHEREAYQLIKERANIPVVMAHTMAGDLGIKERTVTAVLNAKLIRIVDSFLEAVQRSMQEKGVKSRLLVFKGDGGLMTMEAARARPIETIMSGPAASLIGGRTLSGLEDCIVIDVGGTSTDIAILNGGFPRISRDGAVVGTWKTRVKALDMWTCGLGGDSLVTQDRKGKFIIGPQRALPCSVAALEHPSIHDKLPIAKETGIYTATGYRGGKLTEAEASVLDFFERNGPSSLFDAMDGVPSVIRTLDTIDALRSKGCALHVGPTPTDAMVVLDLYDKGDKKAARTILGFMAERMNCPVEEVAKGILDQFITRVGEELVKMAVHEEVTDMTYSDTFNILMRSLITDQPCGNIRVRTGFDRPLIGIGAPAQHLIKPLEGRISSPVVIPDGFDVGNAVGAVCSMMTEFFSVQMFPGEDKYVVISPGSSPSEYRRQEEAMAAARRIAEYTVLKRLEEAGTVSPEVRIEVVEERFADGYNKDAKFLNWAEVRAIGIAKPKI